MNTDKEAHSRDILEQAIADHKPEAVFLMFSGGDDSMTLLHFFKDDPSITAAVFINTGTAIEETIDHVHRTASLWNISYLEYSPKPERDYGWYVRKFGMPGPGMHSQVFRWLKLRQIERLVREHKRSRNGRVMLVTGVRKEESVRRMGTVDEVKRVGAQVWVAPLIEWSSDDKYDYMETHGITRSQVAVNLHMSGECLCGSFAKPGEKEMIRFFYPKAAARLDDWERMAFTAGQTHACRWGERPGKPVAPSQQWLPLCQSCPTRWESVA